jgi:dimethylhistidine N-methyltransferase
VAHPLLVQDEAGDFADAVRAGLAQPQKVIPARFFYDRAGSELFEAITELPEYYPTRTEIGILAAQAAAIGGVVGPGRAVVEFGSGSSTKTPLLLHAIAPAAYVPVDISAEFLASSSALLAADFPWLPVLPVAGDFTMPFKLPSSIASIPKLGFFPGSTIGNMSPLPAVDLLRGFAQTLGRGSYLAIGFDLAASPTKPLATLCAAYDDAAGVTAAFNLNLLARINRDLGGSIRLAEFAHRVVWNPNASRIEMHLAAVKDTYFEAAGASFQMTAGETIHTENSHKWPLAALPMLAQASGWTPVQQWQDAQCWFSVQLWRRDPAQLEP